MIETRNLSFSDLFYKIPCEFLAKSLSSKVILKGISGDFRTRQLSAVLGPTGCGKSSLLDALSGYNQKNVTGTIRINGSAVSTNDIRRISSYIMQDYTMHNFLTVHETLVFAATIKIKNVLRSLEKVELLMESFGMTDWKETIVKHLSHGQQKRLSIAIELVDDPSILFLDEPTSGLDFSSATQCIKLLKQLAQQGKTIICSIHAPSAFMLNLFDNVYALADGCCVYQGSTTNLIPFLQALNLICPQTSNPSDFLLEIATNDYGPLNLLLTKKILNGKNQDFLKPMAVCERNEKSFIFPSSSTQSFSHQLKQLMHRRYLLAKRDKSIASMRLIVNVFLSLALGAVYRGVGNEASRFQENYGYVITISMFQTFFAFFSVISTSKLKSLKKLRYLINDVCFAVPLEFPILKREIFNRWYSLNSFFSAFILFDLPITLVSSFIFIPITYLLTDQPREFHRYAIFFLILLGLSFAAQGLGIMFSASLDTTLTATYSPYFLAPFIVFTSALIVAKDAQAWVQWAFRVNFVENAIQGSLQPIFGFNRSKVECNEAIFCRYRYPEQILKDFGDDVSAEQALIVLWTSAIFYRLIAYWLLNNRINRHEDRWRHS